ncbi:MAG: outer membrane beta-barrel protein, partial [Nevskiales bacterium]
MQSLNRTFSASVLAVAGLAAAAGAQAQGSTTGSGYSWYAPGTTYMGLNAGQSDYSLSSGVGAFPSDKTHSTYN